MQKEGIPKFLKSHQNSVRSVAFSPRDRYIFCSGSCDGKVNVYTALRLEVLLSFTLATSAPGRVVNGVRFNSDGTKILATTSGRRFVVLDVERGNTVMGYDNCAFSGRDRTGIAADPLCPQVAVCVAVNGKGLSLMDLRMPLPLDFLFDLHLGTIRDAMFLHNSWPWTGNQSCLLTSATDGTVKVIGIDGRTIHQFTTNHLINTVCTSPETFNLAPFDAFYSVIMCGGAVVQSYVPDIGLQETLKEHKKKPVWKLRYTSNGSTLYSASEDGWVRRYRRYPDHHNYLGKVYSHTSDIYDLDICPLDEYLVTASKDRTVGVLKLGTPSHGFTEYSELT